jgi:hypothetical protein
MGLLLPVEHIGDDGFEIARLDIGFAPDLAHPPQVVHCQVDVLIVATGHDRGRLGRAAILRIVPPSLTPRPHV